MHAVQLAELGGFGAEGLRGSGAQLGELVVEPAPAAERIVGPAGDRLRLEHRECREQLLVADPAASRRDGAFGADHRGRRGEQVGGVCGRLAEPGAGSSPLELGHDDLGAVDEQVVPVVPPVGDARRPQTRELLPGVVERRIGDRGDRGPEERLTGEPVLDEHRDRPGIAGQHHARDAHAGLGREQLHVRLVFHLLATGPHARGRCVLARDVAPRASDQLRVGFVAAERSDAERSVRALREKDRPADGLVGGRLTARHRARVDGAPGSRIPGWGDRWACRTRSGPRPQRSTRAPRRRGGRWERRARCTARPPRRRPREPDRPAGVGARGTGTRRRPSPRLRPCAPSGTSAPR